MLHVNKLENSAHSTDVSMSCIHVGFPPFCKLNAYIISQPFCAAIWNSSILKIFPITVFSIICPLTCIVPGRIYMFLWQKLIYTVPICRSWYILCQYTLWLNLLEVCAFCLNWCWTIMCAQEEKKKDKFHVVKERNMVDGYIRNSIRLTRLL